MSRGPNPDAPRDEVGPGESWAWAPSVGSTVHDGVLYLAVLPDGPPIVLDEVGAIIWVSAGGRSTEALLQVLADERGWASEEIRASVEGFVADLAAAGLLVPAQEESPA